MVLSHASAAGPGPARARGKRRGRFRAWVRPLRPSRRAGIVSVDRGRWFPAGKETAPAAGGAGANGATAVPEAATPTTKAATATTKAATAGAKGVAQTPEAGSAGAKAGTAGTKAATATTKVAVIGRPPRGPLLLTPRPAPLSAEHVGGYPSAHLARAARGNPRHSRCTIRRRRGAGTGKLP